MENSTPITEDVRKLIYDDLADATITALQRGELFTEDSEDAAAFILEHLDTLSSHEELFTFLDKLATSWTAYSIVVENIKNRMTEDTKIKSILQKLNTI